MSKTQELLQVYRLLTQAIVDRDGLVVELHKAQDAVNVAQTMVERANGVISRDLDERTETDKFHRERIRYLNDEAQELYGENAKLREQNNALVDAFFDLVGGVVEAECRGDEYRDLFSKGVFNSVPASAPAEVITFHPHIMDEDDDRLPVNCLSCGEEKGRYLDFFCDECFEIDAPAHDLWYELRDAWEKGARDFPRPGRNAKEF